MVGREDEDREREKGRGRPGSRFYLAVGQPAPSTADTKTNSKLRQKHPKPVVRDSHRVYAERRKRRNEEMDSHLQIEDERVSERNRDKELTPVREVSSPATGANALGIIGLRFPTFSSEGANGITPPKEDGRMPTLETPTPSKNPSRFSFSTPNLGVPEDDEEGTPRWSSATSKPPPAHCVIRRESQMEHPAPVTPPNWGKGTLGIVGQRLMGGEGRPGSLGLYDHDGFLRSSPERGREVERKEGLKKEARNAKKLSGFVM